MPNRVRKSVFVGVALMVIGANAALAEADAGSYLAARLAGHEQDYEHAAAYFTRSLEGDPENAGLLESAIVAYMGLGDFVQATPLAQRMAALGYESQTANIVIAVDAARTGDWPAIFEMLESGRTISPLVDGLMQGWASLGQGRMSRAVTSFDEVIGLRGLQAFGLYHKALALALAGDFEGADAIFSMSPEDGMQRTRQSVIAYAEILSQLDRNTDAVAMLDSIFGPEQDAAIVDLRYRLGAGEPIAFDFVKSASDGIAEVLYSLASALEGEADDGYVLIYARATAALRPDHTEANILAGRMLVNLGRYDLANDAYARVPRDDMSYHTAELGRSDALRQAGKMDEAIEVLQALALSHASMPLVHASLGDLLRQNGDMRAANAAYSTAIELYDDSDSAKWFVLYTRGITYERLGEWAPAEADFRASLALNPGHPSVLNYLGYSLVEKQIKLDEALEMIQEAAAARPDSGAIIDSLGWVLYRLGRYDEAVDYMEHAAELEPVDPIVNDHLGDVLWAVGRTIEARFQWHRALSFDPTEEDAARIRRKLEIGLDAVLIEEGAPPLKGNHDGG